MTEGIDMFTDEDEAIENDSQPSPPSTIENEALQNEAVTQKRQTPEELASNKRPRLGSAKKEDPCSENGDQMLLQNRMLPLSITVENELANVEPESIAIRLADDEVVTFRKVRAKAMLPTRGSARAAGFDLYTPIRISLAPFERFTLRTHIAVQMPENTYGRIAPRSGLCAAEGVTCLGGVIDPDYEGEIMVILINLDPTEATSIKKGSRVAQLILERVHLPLHPSPTHAYSHRGTKCLGEASGI